MTAIEMRILFVAFPDSIHAVRWISQFPDQDWDLHLAPSLAAPLHPDLAGSVTFHGWGKHNTNGLRLAAGLLQHWPYARGSGYAKRFADHLTHGVSPAKLARLIRTIKPDIVHSLEIQHAGYVSLAAQQILGDAFPTWVVSNWGSDIYLFGQLAEHRARVQQVLATCDYLVCECERDVALARQFGFRGQVAPVLPAAGGYDLDKWQRLRQPGPTSGRRLILLKGYQNWAGRALVGLRALELCADVLQDYRIIIPLAAPDVILAAEILANRTGLSIGIAPHVDYADAMRRFGAARVHIGLSISDGISQSLLESMVMGAVPIQSCTACADEWIENGRNGFIVPPEDPHIIADALRRAVTDDEFVDQAVAINDEIVPRRLAYAHIRQQAVAMYCTMMDAKNAPVVTDFARVK